MSEENVREHSTAGEDAAALMSELTERAARIVADPESLIEVLTAQMSGPDLRFMQSVMYRRLLSASYAEALRDGPYGWIDDILAFRNDWGFALDDITGQVRFGTAPTTRSPRPPTACGWRRGSSGPRSTSSATPPTSPPWRSSAVLSWLTA